MSYLQEIKVYMLHMLSNISPWWELVYYLYWFLFKWSEINFLMSLRKYFSCLLILLNINIPLHISFSLHILSCTQNSLLNFHLRLQQCGVFETVGKYVQILEVATISTKNLRKVANNQMESVLFIRRSDH